MRRSYGLVTVVALLLAVAAPVAAEPDPEATFRRERVFFQCSGDVRLENVNAIDGHVTWSKVGPGGSVADGYGCGHLETTPSGPNTDLVIEGTFTGNLDLLTVHLHEMAHSDQLPAGTQVGVTLAVDGVERLHHLTTHRLPVSSENSGVTNSAEFSITGLAQDYAVEPGNGSQVRTLRLVIEAPRESPSFWVWGTTEVQAGITFNPPAPAGTVFPVDQ